MTLANTGRLSDRHELNAFEKYLNDMLLNYKTIENDMLLNYKTKKETKMNGFDPSERMCICHGDQITLNTVQFCLCTKLVSVHPTKNGVAKSETILY